MEVAHPIRSGRQPDLGGSGVTGTGCEAIDVGMHDRAEGGGALAYEHRIAAEINGIDPAARARPDVGPQIGDRPGHSGFLSRVVLRLGHHAGDLEISGVRGDDGGNRPGIVGLVELTDAALRIGLDHEVAALDRGRQGHGLADGIAFAGSQTAVLRERADQPALSGGAEVGVVREVNRVDPGAGEQVTPVFHRVAEAVTAARVHSSLGGQLGDRQIGGRDAQDADRTRLVIVVVELARVVWVEVRGERVFEDRVVGVAPDGQKVLAGIEVIRNRHPHAAEIVLADSQVALVGDAGEEDVALPRARTGLVAREPEGVCPTVDAGHVVAGRIAQSRIAATVGHLVAHLDARTMHRLVGCHDAAGDQIGERNRVDMELRCLDVVAFARVFVEVVVGVGDHQQPGGPSESERNTGDAAFVGIALAGRQGRAVVEAAYELVVGAQFAVEG